MKTRELAAKAEAFRELHRGAAVLLLPNVWDVVSAKLYEVEGFRAVGTTSAGIASTLGFPDGQRMGIEETATVVRRIAARVDVPISADIEAGYSESPEGAALAARAVLEAGAAGINIEDSLSGCGIAHYAALSDIPVQQARIEAIRATADSEGVPLVINARTDVFLVESGSDRVAAAVERGNAYLAAGADGVFVPDMGDLTEDELIRLVEGIDGPLNVIAGERTPPIRRLTEIGVARLSFGPRPMRTALWELQRMAREWRESGTYTRTLRGELGYEDVNGWFAEDSSPNPRRIRRRP